MQALQDGHNNDDNIEAGDTSVLSALLLVCPSLSSRHCVAPAKINFIPSSSSSFLPITRQHLDCQQDSIESSSTRKDFLGFALYSLTDLFLFLSICNLAR